MEILKKISKRRFCKRLIPNKLRKKSKYLRFFDYSFPYKFNEKVEININLNEKYYGRFFDNKKYLLDNKIQLIKIKHSPFFYFRKVSEDYIKNQKKVILNLEGFCSLNFFFRYCFNIGFNLNQNLIRNNLKILKNFSDLKIMKKMEIILLLDLFGFKSESLMGNLIDNLEESILNKNLEKEIFFYYDFFTILHFMGSILTKYRIKENNIKIENILNPKFLNRFFSRIIEKTDQVEKELFLNFISEKLYKESRNYLFEQFLKNIFFKMLYKKI